MIVQRPYGDNPPLVIELEEHQSLAGQFAAAFGNDTFEALDPADEMRFVVRHHDAGWASVDAEPPVDAATGLPPSLNQTPWPVLLAVGPASVDLNERFHAYAGLIASMHLHGLYHDRYGLSAVDAINGVVDEYRVDAEAIIEREGRRRRRLEEMLRSDAATARWVDPDVLFCNYFRLQFFDRLALTLNLVAPELIEPVLFHRVPVEPGREVTISLKPIAPGVIEITPFPFAGECLEVTFGGRPLPVKPGRTQSEMVAALRDAEVATCRFVLLEEA
jgi:hypothetical protein